MCLVLSTYWYVRYWLQVHFSSVVFYINLLLVIFTAFSWSLTKDLTMFLLITKFTWSFHIFSLPNSHDFSNILITKFTLFLIYSHYQIHIISHLFSLSNPHDLFTSSHYQFHMIFSHLFITEFTWSFHNFAFPKSPDLFKSSHYQIYIIFHLFVLQNLHFPLHSLFFKFKLSCR